MRAVLERAPELRTEAAQAGRSALEAMLLDRATALPTLPIVLDRVKEILIEQGEIGIVFIDIEQFEAIEAEYGWAFFDELLCNVGQIISAEAKERFRNADRDLPPHRRLELLRLLRDARAGPDRGERVRARRATTCARS